MKDYNSRQNPLKMLECFLVKCFFENLQALNLQLCGKINFTTSIFQLICLPFKNNCLPEKTSRERVRILKFNLYYVTQGVLLFIFSCCSWYVSMTYNRHFTKQEWIAWMDSTWFQVQSIKTKGNMESAVWKFTMASVVHSVWIWCGNYMLMSE